MAITSLSRDVLTLNEGAEITITSASAVVGIDAKGGDYKTLLLFANAGGASATATIAKGDGFQGAGSDLVITVGAGETMGVVVDSGYYKQTEDADYKGYFKVTPSAALNISAIELPQ